MAWRPVPRRAPDRFDTTEARFGQADRRPRKGPRTRCESSRIVDDAIRLGVAHVWMQPGAESDTAVRRAEEAGLNVIHSGPCLLVALGFTDA